VILALIGKISAYQLKQNQRFIDGLDAEFEDENEQYINQLSFSEGVGASYHSTLPKPEVKAVAPKAPVKISSYFASQYSP
jgi:hypothetical protein